ncbi:MAG: L,D-transpeptidase family protein [Bacteroidia bacterium]|nr:L,D-transpeptidase family protein [Bacteroidia bacterium]
MSGRNLFLLFILIITFSIAVTSCKRKSKRTPADIQNFDEDKMKVALKAQLETYRKDSTYKHFYDTLSVFYTSHGFETVWLSKLDKKSSLAILNVIDSSVFDGLNPNHYNRDNIAAMLVSYKKLKGDSLYLILAKLELQLSNGLTTLWHDKVLGRTDPKKVLGSKYTLPFPAQFFDPLVVIQKSNGLELLSKHRPSHPDYLKLRMLLWKYIGKTEIAQTLIDTTNNRKIKPGDSSVISPLLAKRLFELGYVPDTLVGQMSLISYDRRLSTYVQAFQKAHNITDDGIIGKTTLKLLNESQIDKINEIRANMERLRWYDAEPVKPYVKVNIPEFRLYLHYADSIGSMAVCVGKGKERLFDQKKLKYEKTKRYIDQPQNNETPQVFSNIDHVILNPTWTVPSSIVGREMFGKILRDPGYLPANGYKVFSGKDEVSAYNINWKKYGPSNIPYTIRQNPGDDNSLGKIKFTFLNPFSVYLHDTPLKSKFKSVNRAVSHGCVRVEDPVRLAAFILQQNVKTTNDDFRVMVGLSPADSILAPKWRADTNSIKKIVTDTKPVRVENKMAVVFDYRTVVFDAEGQVHFYYDVYDKNRLIVEAMDKP